MTLKIFYKFLKIMEAKEKEKVEKKSCRTKKIFGYLMVAAAGVFTGIVIAKPEESKKIANKAYEGIKNLLKKSPKKAETVMNGGKKFNREWKPRNNN